MSKKAKKPQRTHAGTVKVGPDQYDVYDVPDLHNATGGKLDGQAKYPEGEILLEASQKPRRRRSTLFHECLHVVSWQYEIGLSEKQVRRLETGLLNLIDDNPDLLK